MPVHQELLRLTTSPRGFRDIGPDVQAVVDRSGIRVGVCAVFVQHTSASLVIQENADPAVRRDLRGWLDALAPDARAWEHADEGPDDMPAHAKSAITKTSEQIPIRDGALAFGTWQALYLLEHRVTTHTRSLVVTVMG